MPSRSSATSSGTAATSSALGAGDRPGFELRGSRLGGPFRHVFAVMLYADLHADELARPAAEHESDRRSVRCWKRDRRLARVRTGLCRVHLAELAAALAD